MKDLLAGEEARDLETIVQPDAEDALVCSNLALLAAEKLAVPVDAAIAWSIAMEMLEGADDGDTAHFFRVARLVAQAGADDEMRWRLGSALTKRCAEEGHASLVALAVEGAALLSGMAPAEARKVAEPFALFAEDAWLFGLFLDGLGTDDGAPFAH